MPKQVLCEVHWKRVPSEIQQAIRREKHTRGDAWKAAVQRAVDHIRAEISADREMENYIRMHENRDLSYPWKD